MNPSEHPASRHQAMLGRLAYLGLGMGVAAVRVYGGARVLITAPPGTPLIVELPLLDPCATVEDGVMTLRPGAIQLNLITAQAVWARLVNGNGDTVYDCDVSEPGGAGSVWLSAGGSAGLTLFEGGETSIASGVLG